MDDKVSYKMNLPADVDRWIRVEAAKACRSRSGQIIFILQERMTAATGEGLRNSSPAAALNHQRPLEGHQ